MIAAMPEHVFSIQIPISMVFSNICPKNVYTVYPDPAGKMMMFPYYNTFVIAVAQPSSIAGYSVLLKRLCVMKPHYMTPRMCWECTSWPNINLWWRVAKCSLFIPFGVVNHKNICFDGTPGDFLFTWHLHYCCQMGHGPDTWLGHHRACHFCDKFWDRLTLAEMRFVPFSRGIDGFRKKMVDGVSGMVVSKLPQLMEDIDR